MSRLRGHRRPRRRTYRRVEVIRGPGSSVDGEYAYAEWQDVFASRSVLDDANGHYVGINHFLPSSDNTDVRYPGQVTSFGGVYLPYPQDYSRPGRRLWLSVGYTF